MNFIFLIHIKWNYSFKVLRCLSSTELEIKMPINPPGLPPGSYGPPPPESGCLMSMLELIWKLVVGVITVGIIVYIIGVVLGL